MAVSGIILVDKPAGWTSHDVVAKLRGILRERRIGHSGTLDPMATGLLAVFIGRATRAVEFAEAHNKRYLASFRPGLVTDTQDVTGNVLETHEPDFSQAELEAVLQRFRGDIMQLPPMYSAIKINGQKLYDIARRGGEAERKLRPVVIHSLEQTGRDGGDWLLDVCCSKGTYIRTLCHDIGQALGCGGCLSALRRVQAGSFRIEDAHTMDEIQAAANRAEAGSLILPIDSLFPELPALTADQAQEKKCRVGAEFSGDAPDGRYRLYSRDGEFLALCRSESGRIRTEKSFFEVNIT